MQRGEAARWGGGRRKQKCPLTTQKRKNLQHKPAQRRGKWFSGPVLPEEQAALLDIMSSTSKQWKNLNKWGCNFNSMISAGPEPPWSTSDSLLWLRVPSWTHMKPNLRAAAASRENTEGPVFLRFGPARPGLAWTGQAWPGLLQLGTFSKSLTQSNITGLSLPGPEGLAPAHCLYNHWEFPHVPNLIFSFFSNWCFSFFFFFF